jgi:hypothetical protein
MQTSVAIPTIEYFEACARIRNITVHALLKRLLKAIGEDQLVGSILDDQDEMAKRQRGEWRHRGRSCPTT